MEPTVNLMLGSSIISIAIAFILGFLIGYLIKRIIEVGLIVVAIIVILIAIGMLSPSTVVHDVAGLSVYIGQVKSFAESQIKILPYNSIFFIIGFVVGLIKSKI